MERVRVSKTLSQDVLIQLRSDILNGRLKPGARLKMAELTARLSVSLSVLREALNRLVEQGLVVLEPQVGFRVTPLSAADLIDLTTARIHVEGVACRESVRLGDHQWEADLLATHHLLSRTSMLAGESAPPTLSEDWVEAHSRFHEALIAGCGSSHLIAAAASLRDSAELYRHWSGPIGMEEHRDVPGEHRAILDAALARAGEATYQLLRTHIQHTTDLLLGSKDGNTEAARAAR